MVLKEKSSQVLGGKTDFITLQQDLGVAGDLAFKLLGFGNWYDTPLWVTYQNLLDARWKWLFLAPL